MKSWRRFRFEISSFALIVLGVWLIWKLSHKPFVQDWIVYVIVLWCIALALHLWRIIYLIRKTRKK
ncbi:MAG: 2TM domain-containing protein [Chitinophagaceae bacterium]